MKFVLLSLMVSLASAVVFAAPVKSKKAKFNGGTFNLYAEANHKTDESCDVGTSLVLDQGKLLGKVAYLENFVNGMCELYVNPAQRMYKLSKGEDDGCGSIVYTGERTREDGERVTIEITDNRKRTCEDVFVANIVVSEAGNSLYSK